MCVTRLGCVLSQNTACFRQSFKGPFRKVVSFLHCPGLWCKEEVTSQMQSSHVGNTLICAHTLFWWDYLRKKYFSGEEVVGERQSKKWEKLIFFIPSADTCGFVQCCFSTDYTDFSGSMTDFSAALPPPPPSWTHSDSVVMCLLCMFHGCLGEGCGESQRYLTSKGLATNSTQCVWDQPLFKHPAPGI